MHYGKQVNLRKTHIDTFPVGMSFAESLVSEHIGTPSLLKSGLGTPMTMTFGLLANSIRGKATKQKLER